MTYAPKPFRERVCRAINRVIGLASVLMAVLILLAVWARHDAGIRAVIGAKATAANLAAAAGIYVIGVVLLLLLKRRIRKSCEADRDQ